MAEGSALSAGVWFERLPTHLSGPDTNGRRTYSQTTNFLRPTDLLATRMSSAADFSAKYINVKLPSIRSDEMRISLSKTEENGALIRVESKLTRARWQLEVLDVSQHGPNGFPSSVVFTLLKVDSVECVTGCRSLSSTRRARSVHGPRPLIRVDALAGPRNVGMGGRGDSSDHGRFLRCWQALKLPIPIRSLHCPRNGVQKPIRRPC